MVRPAIIAVDDDVTVLRAIERDLRARYAADYLVVAGESGEGGLDATRQLTLRGTPVALFLVDQRMPEMTGIEMLAQILDIQPDAKRVLLTAYADTEAAIRAINDVKLDHYLLKPWDPPEEKLYPVLDDLLEDWNAAFRPPFEGIRLISGRWSPRGHSIRDFLTRNQVPYQWLDPETDEEGRRLVATLAEEEQHVPHALGNGVGASETRSRGVEEPRIEYSELVAAPIVVFPDGQVMRNPSNRDIGEKVGLSTHAALPFYDVVIVGGGPGGLAAAVYGASEGLKTLLVEREAPGGQAGTTSRIENYLGFPAGLSGGDLARRALTQARRLGAEILTPMEVTGLRRADPYRTVVLSDGSEVSCQTCVIASGVSYRRLDVPGIEPLVGAGVFYGAATTEAVLYRDLDVGVVGGGNSAGQAALYLSRFARQVYIVIRGDSLAAGMSQYLVDQIEETPNIALRSRSAVAAVSGDGHLESVVLRGDDGEEELRLAALFLTIGQRPRTDWLEGVLQRDATGFLLAGTAVLTDGRPPPAWGLDRDPLLLETSVPGVFAAGDVRYRSIKRIASAVGEGAMAIALIHQYLAGS